MALHTNYARNPSIKQVHAYHVKCAVAAIRAGQTRDQFLQVYKPEVREAMGKVYDEVVASGAAAQPEPQTFTITLEMHDGWVKKQTTNAKPHKLRDLRAAKAKALAEAKFWGKSDGYTAIKVSITDAAGRALGAYEENGAGGFVWRAANPA